MLEESIMEINDKWLRVGKVVAAHGLKGELKINPRSDFPERFTKPGKRWLQTQEEPPQKIELLSGRKVPGKSVFIVRLKGITSREAAESLIGKKFLVPESLRPKLSKNEFHLLDLIGLEAKSSLEEPTIGKVVDLKKGGNDLLEIELVDGKKVLIPFVKEIVPHINIAEGWLILLPPPGLLEL